MIVKLIFILLLIIVINIFLFRYLGVQLFEAFTIFFYKGAPFVKTSDEKLKIMFELADLKEDDKVVDLGSGDGKLLFAVSKLVKSVVGYEINPFVYKRSVKIWKKDHAEEKNITIEKKNFLKVDLSDYDVVFVYGIDYLMADLEEKLQKELKPGTRVVSNYYKFPNWKAEKEKDGVYLFVKEK